MTKWHRQFFTVVACLVMFSVGLCACDTLKKKFIRQKKGGQETTDFVPVLEPQEYPAPQNNPVLNYQNHYALIKAWYRDLWTGIDDKNDSMVKQSIRQILDHIEQMKPLLKADKAKGLDELASLLKFYRTSLDQPRMARNYARIQSDLRSFDRMLRDHFSAGRLKGNFINQ